MQLFIVHAYVGFLNFILSCFEAILFRGIPEQPLNILIYKVGNIGDTVCAIPSFAAIRKRFPGARIALLASPGKRGAPGARELFDGSDLFDELQIYYSEDISTKEKKKAFIEGLKEKKYDLFIQLPEDLARFRTMLRNMFFAKLVGAKSAIGFRVNTTQIFKKAQVDNLTAPQETERLLNLLKKYGITTNKVEFPLPITEEAKEKVGRIIKNIVPELGRRTSIIAINPGGKRESNCWPIERYRELAEYLHQKHNARIAVFGGPHEKELGDKVLRLVPDEYKLNACGTFSLLESAECLRHVALLVSNSTGTIHLGATVGVPCVGLYSVRDIPGKWSPYGNMHKVLYHLNFSCNYNSESCIKKSVEAITLEEAKEACDIILKQEISN